MALRVTKEQWDKILEHCRRFDVEEGEGPEYKYSVRSSTKVLTIWTQEGWLNGWYQARVTLKNRKLEVTRGQAPKPWTDAQLEQTLSRLLELVKE